MFECWSSHRAGGLCGGFPVCASQRGIKLAHMAALRVCRKAGDSGSQSHALSMHRCVVMESRWIKWFTCSPWCIGLGPWSIETLRIHPESEMQIHWFHFSSRARTGSYQWCGCETPAVNRPNAKRTTLGCTMPPYATRTISGILSLEYIHEYSIDILTHTNIYIYIYHMYWG